MQQYLPQNVTEITGKSLECHKDVNGTQNILIRFLAKFHNEL